VAGGAYRLDVFVVLSGGAEVVVVFVALLARHPDVTAIGARQGVRGWKNPDVYEVIHAASRLLLVTVADRHETTARLRTRLRLVGTARLGIGEGTAAGSKPV